MQENFTINDLSGRDIRMIYISGRRRSIIWKMMKVSMVQVTLAMIFTCLVMANDNYAQKVLERKVNVSLKRVTLERVLQEIEATVKVKFVYSRSYLKMDEEVSIDASGRKLIEVLEELLVPRRIEYRVEEISDVPETSDYIILTQRSEAKDPVKEDPDRFANDLLLQTITGKVSDGKGITIPGVSILVKGSNSGTVTDASGHYTLNIPDGDAILVFSSIGYTTQEIPVNGRTVVDVTLVEDVQSLQEVVVVGYSVKEKKNLTGAVVSVEQSEFRASPDANVASRLQGRVAGVTIINDNSPGGDVSVRVRGFGSINNNNPLYIIDGVPTTGGLSKINPNSIESITVLKDASSSAIYGSRAANGVIIVTTKRGKAGQPKFNFDARYGVQQATNQLNLLNAKEYGELYWLEYKNRGLQVGDPGWGNPQYGYGATPVIPDYIFPAGKMEGEVDESLYNYPTPYNGITRANKAGTNWYDIIFVPAPIQEYNLEMSGGDDKSNYAFSGGYMDQKGIVDYTGFKRYSLRLNAGVKITKSFEVGANLGMAYIDRNSFGNNSENNPISYAQNIQPIIPVYDIKGNFAGTKAPLTGEAANPLATLIRNKDNFVHEMRILASPYAQIKLMKDLTFKTLLGVDYNSNRSKSRTVKDPEFTLAKSVDRLSDGFSGGIQYNWANTLDYKKTIGEDHNVNVLLGVEEVNSNSEYINAARTTYAFSDVDYMVLDAGEKDITNGGSFDQWRTFSYFGRLNYDFRGKYLVEGVVRRDGSSRFSKANRWGTFPAFSAGWRISDEAFMADVISVDELKLRAGWGKNGNDNVGNYNAYSTYRANIDESYYNITGASRTKSDAGFHKYKLGNPDGKWESTATINLGLDLIMFNNKFEANLDFFSRKTSDMLYPDSRPATWGLLQLPSVNMGEMTNKGFDLMLHYRGNTKRDFNYNFQVNLSHYKNEVVSLNENPNEIRYGSSLRLLTYTASQAGQPISSFYGYEVEGIFNTQEEVDAWPKYNPDINGNDVYSMPGVFKYKDVNGDGKITSGDRTFIGSPHPDLSYGLNINLQYKSWDMAMFFHGVYGNEIVNYQNRWLLFNLLSSNREKRRLYESWTPERYENGDKITVPIAKQDDIAMQQPSSFFVEDGSYLRMKNLEIGYTLPEAIASKVKIANLRVYVQATNLFTITKYSGLDPEIRSDNDLQLGVDAGIYPTSQMFMVGINLGL